MLQISIKKLSETAFFKDKTIVRDGVYDSPGYRGQENRRIIVCAFGKADTTKINQAMGVSCVIADAKIAPKISVDCGLVIAENPLECLIGLHLHLIDIGFYNNRFPTVIHESATIHPTCWIDRTNVSIGPGVKIGPNSVILSGSNLLDGVTIGANVTIGSSGFDVREFNGRFMNLPHVGGVELREGCEIQSNSAVSKALFVDCTIIGEESVVAHNCFISHGSKIGSRVRIGPGAVVCGSVNVESNVWIGPNATVSNGLSVGKGAFISIGSVVIGSLPEGARTYAGFARVKIK